MPKLWSPARRRPLLLRLLTSCQPLPPLPIKGSRSFGLTIHNRVFPQLTLVTKAATKVAASFPWAALLPNSCSVERVAWSARKLSVPFYTDGRAVKSDSPLCSCCGAHISTGEQKDVSWASLAIDSVLPPFLGSVRVCPTTDPRVTPHC